MNVIRSRAHPVRRLLTSAQARVRRAGQKVRHLRPTPPLLGEWAPLRPAPVPVPVRAGAPVRSVQRPPDRW